MPKLKTKCGAKKRFKVTGTGKIRRKSAYKSHKLGHKTNKQKRNLTGFTAVSKGDTVNVKMSLGLY
jgi:large subunit ribosomal protein L35